MGMGEPMLNLDAVLAACERLPGPRHHPPAHDDLHRRLDPRDRAAGRVRHAAAPGALAARRRRSAALGADAGQRALSRCAEVIEACRAFYARKRRRVFVEYVMLAGVNDRYEQALALARAAVGRPRVRAADLQGQPDPLQPHGLAVRGLRPRVDRRLPRRARVPRRPGDGAPHARARHRRRLRAARRARGLSVRRCRAAPASAERVPRR